MSLYSFRCAERTRVVGKKRKSDAFRDEEQASLGPQISEILEEDLSHADITFGYETRMDTSEWVEGEMVDYDYEESMFIEQEMKPLIPNKKPRMDAAVTASGLISGRAPDFRNIQKLSDKTKHFGDMQETDESRIAMRTKQILFGKNTRGYDNYISTVPK